MKPVHHDLSLRRGLPRHDAEQLLVVLCGRRSWAFERAQSASTLQVAMQLLKAKENAQAADAARASSMPTIEGSSADTGFIRRIPSDAASEDR